MQRPLVAWNMDVDSCNMTTFLSSLISLLKRVNSNVQQIILIYYAVLLRDWKLDWHMLLDVLPSDSMRRDVKQRRSRILPSIMAFWTEGQWKTEGKESANIHRPPTEWYTMCTSVRRQKEPHLSVTSSSMYWNKQLNALCFVREKLCATFSRLFQSGNGRTKGYLVFFFFFHQHVCQ